MTQISKISVAKPKQTALNHSMKTDTITIASASEIADFFTRFRKRNDSYLGQRWGQPNGIISRLDNEAKAAGFVDNSVHFRSLAYELFGLYVWDRKVSDVLDWLESALVSSAD